MQRWVLPSPDNRVMNELGFAFLGRMTIDPSSPLPNDPHVSRGAGFMREVDGTASIWNLLNPEHGASDGMLPLTVQE